MPFAFDPLRPRPLRLDHGASLTAFDERKLQPFASAADGGYPELSPWRKERDMPWVLVDPNVGEQWRMLKMLKVW